MLDLQDTMISILLYQQKLTKVRKFTIDEIIKNQMIYANQELRQIARNMPILLYHSFEKLRVDLEHRALSAEWVCLNMKICYAALKNIKNLFLFFGDF